MMDRDPQPKKSSLLRRCAIGALLLAWLLGGIGCIAVDERMQPFLNAWGHLPGVQTAIRLWNQLGAAPGIVLFLLAGVATIRSDRGRTLLNFIATATLAGIGVQTIKHLVGRVRPASAHDTTRFVGPFGLFNHGPPVRLDSLPSGHTTVAFAMAVALAWRWPKWSALWYLLAVGVAISRVLLDSHFPSDVILGALLGTVVGVVTQRWMARRFGKSTTT